MEAVANCESFLSARLTMSSYSTRALPCFIAFSDPFLTSIECVRVSDFVTFAICNSCRWKCCLLSAIAALMIPSRSDCINKGEIHKHCINSCYREYTLHYATYHFWSAFARPSGPPLLLIPAKQYNHPSSLSAYSRSVLIAARCYIPYIDNSFLSRARSAFGRGNRHISSCYYFRKKLCTNMVIVVCFADVCEITE